MYQGDGQNYDVTCLNTLKYSWTCEGRGNWEWFALWVRSIEFSANNNPKGKYNKIQTNLAAIRPIHSFPQDLRLLATDGAFVPVPTCAEILLFRAHDLLQGAHIGSVRDGGEEERGGRGGGRK